MFLKGIIGKFSTFYSLREVIINTCSHGVEKIFKINLFSSTITMKSTDLPGLHDGANAHRQRLLRDLREVVVEESAFEKKYSCSYKDPSIRA